MAEDFIEYDVISVIYGRMQMLCRVVVLNLNISCT